MLFLSQSASETFEIGKDAGKRLLPGSVVALYGDLGAGKTTFLKGLVAGSADYSPDQVSSPTFVLLHIYEGRQVVYHFDLYRLSGPEEFLNLGFEEFLGSHGVCCIEWAERIEGLLPGNTLKITLKSISETERSIEII